MAVAKENKNSNKKLKSNKNNNLRTEAITDGIKCSRCGNSYIGSEIPKNYYMSNSDLYKSNFENRISVCKDCIINIYNDFVNKTNNIKLATKLTCQKLDYYWDEVIFEGALCQSKEKNSVVIQVYIQKINSLKQYSGLTFTDYLMAMPQDNIKESILEKQNKVVEQNEQEKTEEVYNNVKKYSEVWMGNYTISDLKYLDNYFKKLCEDFNIITQNHIDYARKIAKASLVMDKEYSKVLDGGGSDGAYEKYKRIFDDLSKSAQFAESGRGKSLIGNGLTEIVDSVESGQWIFSKEEFEKDDIDMLLEQFGNMSKSL